MVVNAEVEVPDEDVFKEMAIWEHEDIVDFFVKFAEYMNDVKLNKKIRDKFNELITEHNKEK